MGLWLRFADTDLSTLPAVSKVLWLYCHGQALHVSMEHSTFQLSAKGTMGSSRKRLHTCKKPLRFLARGCLASDGMRPVIWPNTSGSFWVTLLARNGMTLGLLGAVRCFLTPVSLWKNHTVVRRLCGEENWWEGMHSYEFQGLSWLLIWMSIRLDLYFNCTSL